MSYICKEYQFHLKDIRRFKNNIYKKGTAIAGISMPDWCSVIHDRVVVSHHRLMRPTEGSK